MKMKYIRTKEGNIYKRLFIDRAIVSGSHGGVCDKDLNPVGETIIKEADTIEELCDEFVVIGIFENQIGCCCDTFKEAKELKDYVELPQEQIIYGAIWTDKGLIYVAKMNEKGDLELL